MVNRLLCLVALLPAVKAWADSSERGPHTTEFSAAAYAQVKYVSAKSGSDNRGNGSSKSPWRSLRYALSRVTSANAERRTAILVAAGQYEATPFIMKQHVDLFGGFEPQGWTRDIFSHATLLDGRETSRVVVAANHSVIDGFVIMRGQVRGKGAGLLCKNTSPKVTNNRFLQNCTLQPRNWCPRQLHEVANDGAAIYCTDGAKPLIANSVFSGNQTETGRGAAIALHGGCSGEIIDNVFLENTTGLDDPSRSSDGGAISVFDWSDPRIANNVFLRNRALAMNDGGALFVALWSAPLIENNLFVDNSAGDDASALFIGGQEHRYNKPKDPMPDKAAYSVSISKNFFVGNSQDVWNPSTLRMTMGSRGVIVNNVMAHNSRFSVEDSKAVVVNNTVLGKVTLGSQKHELEATQISNNVFWGPFVSTSRTPVCYCNLRDELSGKENISADPAFEEDHLRVVASSSSYDPSRFETEFYVSAGQLGDKSLANRVVRVGARWGVVKSNSTNLLTVWGNVAGEPNLLFLPSYRLRRESPCIDKGSLEGAPETDIHGDSRPFGSGVDIGADEFAG